ncbi:MAG: GNAT family N-acetyltransferase [bacterium]|nr:N-acetyltransferase [Gammaproteobacteria bacterium]HIL94634.1 N-acetyltransferase [Pseudomonadales bacterium]
MKTKVHVWHLEMTEQLPVAELPNPERRHYELRKVDTALPEFNRFLYLAVGADWQWHMRLGWTYADWQKFLTEPNTETWVAYDQGTPLGYFELQEQGLGSAEICYFGLLPEFIGQGYGRCLLEDAISKAWAIGGKRVWLHTCTLDHPQALPNYLARGFSVFDEEDFDDDLPDEPIQPWLEANKPHATSQSS